MSEKPKSDNQTPEVTGATLIEIAKTSGWDFAALIFINRKTGEIGGSFPASMSPEVRREIAQRLNLDGEVEKMLLQ